MGIRWDVQADTLRFALAHLDRPQAPSTKRGILSRFSGLYDPLGWASAFVVQAKAMLQHTWARGLGWDAALPPDMEAQWAQWEEEIARLRLFAVPRYYYQNLSKNWIKELVLSCDASEDACAAVAYMRAVSTDGGIVCHLVMAKTRLMLLKTLSVPQGQLMGCQLATRLAKTVSSLHPAICLGIMF